MSFLDARAPHRETVATLVSRNVRRTVLAVLALVAALALLAVTAGVASWLPPLWSSRAGHVSGLAVTGVLGVALFALSWGAWRGRRQAARGAAGLLGIGGLVALGTGDAVIQGAMAAGLGVALLVDRRAFTRGSAPGAVRWSMVAGGALGAVLLVGLLAAHGRDPAGVVAELTATVGWLAGGAWWSDPTSALALALESLLAVAAVATAVAVRAALRPRVGSEGHGDAEHARAAAIVAEYGSDSLDPFCLREDKSFYFGHGGLIAYRTLRETAVVAGDPVGPPGSAAPLLAEFERYAGERGWDVVVTAASPRWLADYERDGWRALKIGEEAVVDPREFSLEGRRVRKLRQSVTRLDRLGWTVELVAGADLSDELAEEIGAVERGWRDAQPRLYGFAMTLGRLWGAPEDVASLYVLGRTPEGELRAFLRFATIGTHGLSLDVMRREGDTPNGLTEALVAAALAHAAASAVREVSLNFAGFAHLMSAEAALGPRQRVARWFLAQAHGRFQLERLLRFNEKFSPAWRSRYLVHRGRTTLPLAGLRVLQAEAYVRPPAPRPLPLRWCPEPAPARAAAPSPGP